MTRVSRSDRSLRPVVVGLALALVAGTLLAGTVEAQRSGQNPEGLTREQMMERIQAQFEGQLARDLNLTPEQQATLAEVRRTFQASREELQPRRAQLSRDLRAYYQNRGSEEEARRLILEARALRDRETQLMQEEEDRLLEVLSPSQVLLMQFLRDQFGGRIRSLGDRDGGPPFGPRGNGTPGAPSGGSSGGTPGGSSGG